MPLWAISHNIKALCWFMKLNSQHISWHRHHRQHMDKEGRKIVFIAEFFPRNHPPKRKEENFSSQSQAYTNTLTRHPLRRTINLFNLIIRCFAFSMERNGKRASRRKSFYIFWHVFLIFPSSPRPHIQVLWLR